MKQGVAGIHSRILTTDTTGVRRSSTPASPSEEGEELEDFVFGGREGLVGDQLELDVQAGFDFGEEIRFFFGEEMGERGADADPDGFARGVEVGGGEEGPAQVEGDGQVGLHAAGAATAGAGLGQGLFEVAPGALAGDLDQAELGDLEQAGPGAVLRKLRLEALEDLAAVLRVFHVDEIHDEDASEVPQADLPRDLGDRFEVRLEDRVFERVAANELAGVDVDRDERFGLVDDDRYPGSERDPVLQGVLELRLDAEPLEERLRLFVQPDAGHELR